MTTKHLYPYLHVRDSAAAIEFYTRAFGAKELFRLAEPGGRIGHAELDFDGSVVMVSDEYPELGVHAADRFEGAAVTLHLHVDDADAAIAAAVQAGATLMRAPQDHFYGERSGTVRDPFGHRWLIGHAIEEVSPQEMQRRYTAAMQGG